MSQFSTNEAVSLEKRLEIKADITKLEDINQEYEVEKCAKWILENNYEKVCLQFPDCLIPNSTVVAKKIEDIILRRVYILGDTAYESCCIDFTSAQHVSADAIIHFGQTCFSKPENIIPFLKIHSKSDLKIDEFCTSLENVFEGIDCKIIILIDAPYLHQKDEIIGGLRNKNVQVLSMEDAIFKVDSNSTPVIYLGENDRKIINIKLSLNTHEFYICNPKKSYALNKYDVDSRILKRRYYLMEKIKDSSTIGIVIGTLAVKNYLKILERIKSLAKLHSKKYYIISVGKPTVAKLANFPEVDVFVVIGCAMNEIYENRDFYKPIVTAYDIECSLNPRHDNSTSFTYDFNSFLTNNDDITSILKEEITSSDVSLVTGNIRFAETKEDEQDDSDEKQIMVKEEGKMVVSSSYGAGYLSSRSWKGLEQNLGEDDPHLAQKGRKGLAQSYENEVQ